MTHLCHCKSLIYLCYVLHRIADNLKGQAKVQGQGQDRQQERAGGGGGGPRNITMEDVHYMYNVTFLTPEQRRRKEAEESESK